MASGSNYKLLIEAQLDPSKVQSQIQALSSKSVLLIQTQFNQADFTKFQDELNRIKEVASSIGKITLFGDQQGGINKAVVEYQDALGNTAKEFITINDQVKITQTYTENLAKDQQQINSLLEKQAALQAKNADEMDRAALGADKFLARAQNLPQTPSVQAAIGKAQEIKVAVAQGDLEKVRELNREFEIMKAEVSSNTTGFALWKQEIADAVVNMAKMAVTSGLVFAAFSQLREGFQYLVDLDKELTNIQLVTGQSYESVAKLGQGYNQLGKEMGATTLEITKGKII